MVEATNEMRTHHLKIIFLESTNERVKWFSIVSLVTLFGLGTWQILYLRRFFKRKRLID